MKKITLVKSLIGCKKDQIATAKALGLKKSAMSPLSPITPAQQARFTRLFI